MATIAAATAGQEANSQRRSDLRGHSHVQLAHQVDNDTTVNLTGTKLGVHGW